MASAPNYTISTSFATDESNQVAGRSTVRTSALDVELQNVSSAINGVNDNLKNIQRADGNIRDGMVTPATLSTDVKAMLATAGASTPKIWAAATAYAVRDVVQYTTNSYLCSVAHTSTGAFDSSKFVLIATGIYPLITPYIETLLDDANSATAKLTLGIVEGVAPTNFITVDGAGKLPAIDGSQLTNLNSTFSTLKTLSTAPGFNFENSKSSISIGDVYGAINYIGNDSSLNANGIRAKIESKSTSATGSSDIKIYVAQSSTTTLTEALSITPAAVSISVPILNAGSANLTGDITASGSINAGADLLGYKLHLSGMQSYFYESAQMDYTETQVDIDITALAALPQEIDHFYLIKVLVNGRYQDSWPLSSTFAGSARLFKTWTQGIVWNGTTWVIVGPVLNYAAYNSDATNFPAGAVNAAKALLVASATNVVLRLQNRTTPGIYSKTFYNYGIEVLKN